MTLWVGDEDFVFVVSDAMKHFLNAGDSCFYLDDTDSIIDNCMQELVHHKPFNEPLDDSQEEDITSMHNKGEIEVRLCKRQWRVVSQGKKSKTTPLFEVTSKLHTITSKLSIFSDFGLELYDREIHTKVWEFSLLESPKNRLKQVRQTSDVK